jgi:hypothetical protein
VTVWDQGVFQPSRYVVETLSLSLDAIDFGIFLFAPDDIAIIREKHYEAVRDNVVFEIGMFIGALGRERTFLIAPRDVAELRLPSDLLGLTFAGYDPDRSDGNLRAALGPACNQIAKLLKAEGNRASSDGRPKLPKELVPPHEPVVTPATIPSSDDGVRQQPVGKAEFFSQLSLSNKPPSTSEAQANAVD